MRNRSMVFIVIFSLIVLSACTNSEIDDKTVNDLTARIEELEADNLELRKLLNDKNSGDSDNVETSSVVPESTIESVEVSKTEAIVSDKIVVAWKPFPDASFLQLHAAAEITNTGNTQVLIKSATFDIEDNTGKLLASEKALIGICPVVVEPGMLSYISLPTTVDGSIDPSTITNVEVTIDYEEKNYVPNLPESTVVNLLVEDINVGNVGNYVNVLGRITNPHDFDVEGFDVAVAIYDSAGNLLGVFQTDNDSKISDGGKIGFETSFPSIEIENFSLNVAKAIGVATNKIDHYSKIQ